MQQVRGGSIVFANSEVAFIRRAEKFLMIKTREYSLARIKTILRSTYSSESNSINEFTETEVEFRSKLLHALNKNNFLEVTSDLTSRVALTEVENTTNLPILNFSDAFIIFSFGNCSQKIVSFLEPHLTSNHQIVRCDLPFEQRSMHESMALDLRKSLAYQKVIENVNRSTRLIITLLDFPDYNFLQRFNCWFQSNLSSSCSWIVGWFEDERFFLAPIIGKKNNQVPSFEDMDKYVVGNSSCAFEEKLWRQASLECRKSDVLVDYIYDSNLSFSPRACAANLFQQINTWAANKFSDTFLTLKAERNGNVSNYSHKLSSFSLMKSEQNFPANLEIFVDDYTGLVSRVSEVFTESSKLFERHFFNGYYCCPRTDLSFLRQYTNRCVGAVGATKSEARFKTICEGLERYCAMSIPENVLFSSYTELIENYNPQRVVTPNNLASFSKKQYSNGDSKFCSPFRKDQEIPWMWGKSITRGVEVLIPTDFVIYPPIRKNPIIQASSSGASAHSSIEAAALNGLYELIERDAFMLTWLYKITPRRLRRDCFTTNQDHAAVALECMGFELVLLTLELDLEIPVVAALALNLSRNYPVLVMGMAANRSIQVAADKAIDELIMQLLGLLQMPKSKHIDAPEKIEIYYQHRDYYLYPDRQQDWAFLLNGDEIDPPSNLPTRLQPADELAWLSTYLTNKGIDSYMVDLTLPKVKESGMVVLKTIATHLQPISWVTMGIPLGGKRLTRTSKKFAHLAEILKSRANGREMREINMQPHPFA